MSEKKPVAAGAVALVEPPADQDEDAAKAETDGTDGESPDDTDSRWLAEIMETAKDLTTTMKQAAS